VITYPNRLAEERTAAGIESADRLASLAAIDVSWYAYMEAGEILPSPEEFERIRAALGGVPAERLYPAIWKAHLGVATKERPNYARFWGGIEDSGHLLVSRDEATWSERNVVPDRQVDVFVNMSCGPQHSPHLILDTVSVLRALGLRVAASAGRLSCCGQYLRHYGDLAASERMNAASLARGVAWGAKTFAHMCTNCQNTYEMFARRERLLGNERPENKQMYTLIEETLRGLRDLVPWRRPVPAKVLVLAMHAFPVHTEASETCARVLAMVPGVEVLGCVDEEMERVAGLRGPDEIVDQPPLSREDVERRRTRLTELFAARGADTMAPMHHTGYQWWARFSGEGLAVRHPFSILADALGCAHPDRYQAALRLGDPEAVLEQTRPFWTSWGMREERARELARVIFDPAYGSAATRCACGGEGACREGLIDVDALTGTTPTASGSDDAKITH
jgi:hypothetical protein